MPHSRKLPPLQPLHHPPTKQYGLLQAIVDKIVVVPPHKGGNVIHTVLVIEAAARSIRI